MRRHWISNGADRASGNAPKLDNGFRSGFEKRVADDLKQRGAPYEYESVKIPYDVPARKSSYTPDLKLANGILVEIKGRFVAKDRQKHLLVKTQRPEIDVRFVFQRSSSPLYKGSKNTYAGWCQEHGFIYADKTVPPEWLREPSRD